MTVLANQKATLNLLASIGDGISQILKNQANSSDTAVMAAIGNLDKHLGDIQGVIGTEEAPAVAESAPETTTDAQPTA